MTSYEALHEPCRTPTCWIEGGEKPHIGSKIVDNKSKKNKKKLMRIWG